MKKEGDFNFSPPFSLSVIQDFYLTTTFDDVSPHTTV